MNFSGSSIFDKVKRAARFGYLKIIRLREKPHSVALGLALGIFIGFTPTIPIQTYIAVGLALMLRCSKIAAAAGVWISNPLTLAPFYYAEFIVGKWVLNSEAVFKLADYSLFSMLENARRAMEVMMVGGIVMGIPAGIVTYFITYRIVDRAKIRREEKRLLKSRESNSPPKPS